ncbi:unnamed protein product [Lathyrus sativus]|nr:unnamed protein product [Lathyrus sativus]
MDPNHFHYQQAIFNFMQNYQNPNSQNSQIPSVPPNPAIFFPSPNNPNMYQNRNPQNSQVSPFSTQDPIVGVDQKAESFWHRIAANYNQYRGQLREKLSGQLKCRWHRINASVQKFVGCYRQAVNGKKSGTSENDIMAAAHAFYAQDQGTTFNLEYAWRLLKDEAKWGIIGESIENSSKMTQTSAGHHRRSLIHLQVMSLTHHHQWSVQWDKKQQKGRVKQRKFQMQRKMQGIKEQKQWKDLRKVRRTR